ncbi:MAG: hypothetical protein ACK5CY_12310 [Bacteroidia bacterium]
MKTLIISVCLIITTQVISAQNIKFFNNTDEQGRFVVSNTILLDIASDNTFSGYYGWAAQGQEEYFIIGKIEGTKITGTKISLSDKSEKAINWTILPDAIKASSPLGITRVDASETNYLEDALNLTFYEQPAFNAKQITCDYSPAVKNARIIQLVKI